MKVVHLMGALLPSGMERMFVSAREWLRELDVDSVIVGQGEDVPFADDLRRAGFRVIVIPVVKHPAGARAWFSLLRAETPDLVHIHDEAAIAVTAVVARAALPRVPVIRTFHNVFSPTGRARVSRQAQLLLTRPLITRRLAVSPAVQRNERRFGQSTDLLLNWVDDRFWALRADRERQVEAGAVERAMVMVGNSSPIKNQRLALRALRTTDLALYFHGDERHASTEERTILDELERAGRVRYRGSGDPGRSLVVGACFVLPSLHEGMSIALSEALAVGMPVLVRDGAGSEWASSFPSVRFLPDAEEDWAAAMVRAADLAPHLGAETTEPPIDLSARRGARQLTEIYREALGRR